MTFVAHAALGAGILGMFSRLFGRPRPWVRNVLVVFGAVLGMLPDALDAVLALLGLIERWSLYDVFHHHCPDWLLALPPVWLHLGTDRLIHLFPGYNWWPDFWYLEIGMWLVAFVLLRVLYEKELEELWERFWRWSCALFSRFRQWLRTRFSRPT